MVLVQIGYCPDAGPCSGHARIRARIPITPYSGKNVGVNVSHRTRSSQFDHPSVSTPSRNILLTGQKGLITLRQASRIGQSEPHIRRLRRRSNSFLDYRLRACAWRRRRRRSCGRSTRENDWMPASNYGHHIEIFRCRRSVVLLGLPAQTYNPGGSC
jgi:hypothetical protein